MWRIPARAPPPRGLAPGGAAQPAVGAGCEGSAPGAAGGAGIPALPHHRGLPNPLPVRGDAPGGAGRGGPHPGELSRGAGSWWVPGGCRLTPPLFPLSPQGVPLDTSKLPADQRLPPYSYSQPGLLLQSQPSQKALHQAVPSPPQPALPPAPPARPPPPLPSGAAQRPYGPQYQPNTPLPQPPPLGQPLSDFGLGSFEQFGMGESPTGNSSGFPEELGSLSYPPAEGAYDPHVLNRQNLSNCSRHGPIPNIILTGDSPPGISKEIATALAGVPGFEVDAAALGLEEDLKIEPLTLDGLNMLSDPYALLTDPAVEDSFRTDRLQ